MRVEFVTRQYPPESIGGIGSYVHEVATAFAEAGHDAIVVHAAPGVRRETTWDGRVRVERFPAVGPERMWSALEKLSFHFATRLRSALSAFAAVRSLPRADVVEAPEWKAEALLLRPARRGPVVVHLHLLNTQVFASYGRSPGFGTRVADRMEICSVRRAHAVTGSSTSSIRLPHGGALVAPGQLRLVDPPLRRGPWTLVPSVRSTDPTVLCIGRLEPLKAPEVVLHALARRADLDGVRAVFIGRAYGTATDEPYDEHLRRVAAGYGIECDVLPPTADPEELCHLLAEARVVAVPSRFETLSMVTLEAMAAGRPVVLSGRIGLAERVCDPEAAPTVDPQDLDGWARELGRFLDDRALAERAGRRNRQRALELTCAESVVSSRLAVYEQVAGRTPGGPRLAKRRRRVGAADPSQ